MGKKTDTLLYEALDPRKVSKPKKLTQTQVPVPRLTYLRVKNSHLYGVGCMKW